MIDITESQEPLPSRRRPRHDALYLTSFRRFLRPQAGRTLHRHKRKPEPRGEIAADLSLPELQEGGMADRVAAAQQRDAGELGEPCMGALTDFVRAEVPSKLRGAVDTWGQSRQVLAFDIAAYMQAPISRARGRASQVLPLPDSPCISSSFPDGPCSARWQA